MQSAKGLLRIRKSFISFVIAIVILGIWGAVLYYDPRTHIYYLDVGQGNATLIRLPHNYDILIDAGPSETVVAEVGAVMPWFDRTIELAFITHAHKDHYYGLKFLSEQYLINKVIVGQTSIAGEGLYNQTLEDLQESGTAIEVIRQPQIFQLNENTKFSAIFVPEKVEAKAEDNVLIDNNSLVLKLETESGTYLFPGDVREAGEERLLKMKIDLHAGVMLAPHHGSHSSSTEEFLRAVNPSLIIISAGKRNSYHHPHADILQRYESLAIPFRRTDQAGTIQLVSGGDDH